MIRILTVAAVVILAAAQASAQGRFYAGVTTATDGGNRGNIPGGAVPSVGGVLGVRLGQAWALELEVERGFRTTTAGTGDSILVSFPPSPNPTREEIERYGILVHSARTQRAGAGWSAHAVWRTREPGRVNVGLLMGVASRVYSTTLVRTTLAVSPLVTLPPTYRLPDETSGRRMVAGGLSGGVVVFVRVTDRLSIAPDFRFVAGLITDDPYRVFRTGVRAMVTF